MQIELVDLIRSSFRNLDLFFVVDVFIDVSLVHIVVSQGLYFNRLLLPSVVDDSLKFSPNIK